MLKIWGRRSSYNVQKAMWLIGELELAHEHINAGGSAGGLDTQAFLAMNPHGRIPVIADDAATVWESHAVLRYLAARYGAGRFWSDDPAQRAAIDGWMDWSQTALQPDFLTGVFWGFYRTPEDKRNWPAINAAPPISASSTGCSTAAPSCSVRPCRSPTSRPARRSIAISNWRSSGHHCHRSSAGIGRYRSARPSGPTS